MAWLVRRRYPPYGKTEKSCTLRLNGNDVLNATGLTREIGGVWRDEDSIFRIKHKGHKDNAVLVLTGLQDSFCHRMTRIKRIRKTFVSFVPLTAQRNLEPAMFRKAYSLEFIARPIRRALPYANMRKAFSLLCQHALETKNSQLETRNWKLKTGNWKLKTGN